MTPNIGPVSAPACSSHISTDAMGSLWNRAIRISIFSLGALRTMCPARSLVRVPEHLLQTSSVLISHCGTIFHGHAYRLFGFPKNFTTLFGRSMLRRTLRTIDLHPIIAGLHDAFEIELRPTLVWLKLLYRR
jgi:hypothetical protein